MPKTVLTLLAGALCAAMGGRAAESAAPRATGEWLDTGWKFSRYHAVREPKGAELTFTASGAVEVIGVCNGDPTDWTGFQAGRQKTFHGLCQAVVRVREGATGPGSLVATGGGLSAKVDFTVMPGD